MNIAELATQALQESLADRLVAVVLFGSRARGEAAPDSDWDLLVIAEELPSGALSRRLFLKGLLPPACRGAVSIIARTRAEFDSHISSLYLDLALDGKVLHDTAGYAAGKLGRLRVLLARSELTRERLASGYQWKPRGEWRGLAWWFEQAASL